MGRGSYTNPPTREAPLGFNAPFWEIGIGGAEVEVDAGTGVVKILKYVSVTDAGKMINPLHCRGQDEGSVLFGIGLALSEHYVYRDGQLTNPNLVEYRIPRFQDLPGTFISHIHEDGGGSGPFGAKGIAEGGISGVAPAVCNAVYNAIGLRFHQVPLTQEMVWQAIRRKENG